MNKRQKKKHSNRIIRDKNFTIESMEDEIKNHEIENNIILKFARYMTECHLTRRDIANAIGVKVKLIDTLLDNPDTSHEFIMHMGDLLETNKSNLMSMAVSSMLKSKQN